MITKFAKELIENSLESDDELDSEEMNLDEILTGSRNMVHMNKSNEGNIESTLTLSQSPVRTDRHRTKMYSSIDVPISNRIGLDGNSIMSRQQIASTFKLSSSRNAQSIDTMSPKALVESQQAKVLELRRKNNDVMKLKSKYESEFRKKIAQSN